MGQAKRRALISALTGAQLFQLYHQWELFAHPHQLPPDQGEDGDWLIWLLMGGRGCGKTRAGAEWIRTQVTQDGKRRIALIAPTYSDAREVMLEGESGLLNIGFPSERPTYMSSRRRLEWPNGAIGQVFTSEEPDGLRGPQFDCAWADEFCAWRYAEDTLSNLRLGLRLGAKPRLMITTTPKPTSALTKLLASQKIHVTTARTQDNKRYLSDGFIEAMNDAYGGSRLGRQELDGILLTDHAGALWTREQIQNAFMSEIPNLSKTVVSIDPPTTSTTKSDACGLIVAGVSGEGASARVFILHDGSVQGATPQAWAQRAIELYYNWNADYILAEVNQGGEMVTTILGTLDPSVPVRTVHASKSKLDRAAPVAVLYEQGRVKHCADFPMLEDEMCQIGSDEGKGANSPDRLDAMVWAVTELLLSKRGRPKIRVT